MSDAPLTKLRRKHQRINANETGWSLSWPQLVQANDVRGALPPLRQPRPTRHPQAFTTAHPAACTFIVTSKNDPNAVMV